MPFLKIYSHPQKLLNILIGFETGDVIRNRFFHKRDVKTETIFYRESILASKKCLHISKIYKNMKSDKKSQCKEEAFPIEL
jgi:hypothetical protein